MEGRKGNGKEVGLLAGHCRVLAKASKGGCPPSFFIRPPSFPHPSLVSLGYKECQKCFDVLNHHHPFAEL